MCPCCETQTNRFNVHCEECFAALLDGRDLECHAAPDHISPDTYTGRHTATAGRKFRVTTWDARELAGLAPEGVMFESFGHVGGVERFSRTRYVADSAGRLHCYDSDGARKIIHPAGRKLRILTK